MCIRKNMIFDILVSKGSRISPEQFDSFIDYIDFDGDGNISLAELEFIFNKGIERNKFVESVDFNRKSDILSESKRSDGNNDRPTVRTSFYDSKREDGGNTKRISAMSESKMEETKS